ncbi:MAG: LysR family transcriptional regulator, partial [Desulfuromonadales bacterium]|nr:LysR family transcriptional regulator [Desulfuromonadales bacterium]
MELYQLKSFVVIARERNLTRAAEKLHLSQSALSSQLRLLEGELGLTLFTRTARGMALTEPGRELFTLAEGMLEAANKLRARAMALHQGVGEAVAIGLNADPGFLRVSAINRRLSLLHAELSVSFRTSQTARTAPMLRQGEVDLAFFYGDAPDADLQHLLLDRVRVCLVIPGRLAGAVHRLDWPEVAELPWVWAGSDSPFYAALLEALE